MTVSAIERTAVEDEFNNHPDWCNPTECVPGEDFVDGTHRIVIDAVHQHTIATFDAVHGDVNDWPVAVRLRREQCGTEDWYVLDVGYTTVRLTADQLAMLRGAS